MRHIIVTRHPAAVEFIQVEAPEFASAQVLETAAPEDVRGAVVAGNLPLHLAALAAEVVAVEFSGPPPRGAEYGQEEMRAAGARLRRYAVTPLPERDAPMRQVAEARQSNSPYAAVLIVRAREGTTFPARGDWVDRGKNGRVRTVDFVPSPDGTLCHLIDGVPRDSEGVVVAASLVGHEGISCLYTRPGARMRIRTGYKLREESHIQVEGPGLCRRLSAAELADTGAGETLSSSLADKLREAGIA